MRTAFILCFMIIGAFAARTNLKHTSLHERNPKGLVEEL